MNEPTKTTAQDQDGFDEIGQLVRFAGERETASDDRVSNAHARVSSHWQNDIASRKKDRRLNHVRQFAIAASLVAVIGTAYFMLNQQNVPTNARLFAVERISGDVLINGRETSEDALIVNDAMIETGSDGLVALRMPDGQSARLGNNTQAVIASRSQIELTAGVVYVDSGPDAHNTYVSIVTPLGVATDIGTQFQVRVEEEQLRIGVREGIVELSRPDTKPLEVNNGQLFELSVNGESSGRRLASDDQIWSWIAEITPPFEIESVTLEDYLVWYTREAGLGLRWESTVSQTIAKNTRLSGTISGMSLDEGLSLVRHIAPFDSRVSESTLHVEVQ